MSTDLPRAQKESPISSQFSQHFFVRVLALVTLLVAFDLWLVRHTGYGLSDPRAVGGIGGAVFMVFGLFKSITSVADEGSWQAWTRRLIGGVLDFRSLAGLYLVSAFVMLTISSVTVIPTLDWQGRKVELHPIDAEENPQTIQLCDQIHRQWVWVSPFGRTYRVKVEGYLPNSFEVYPMAGATIRPDKDLQRSPTILIRPTIEALHSLRQCESEEGVKRCGWFRLCKVEPNAECTEIARKHGYSSSFLIGWPQAVPQDLLAHWRLELSVLVPQDAQKTVAETILAWKDTMLLSPKPSVEVGMTLRAEVYTKSREKELVAAKTFTVPNAPFLDILMEPVF